MIPTFQCSWYVGVGGYYIVRLDEGRGDWLREAEWMDKNCSDGS